MERVRDDFADRVRGCLLGGAIGDALGGPVEFFTRHEIVSHVGDTGVRDYLGAGGGPLVDAKDVELVGLITDDTQMTLFVTEGIIRAFVREDRGLGFTVGVTDHALRRWLDTQEHAAPTGQRDGWLQGEQWLYSRRAPGNTCMSALAASRTEPFGVAADNDSKGCGGVMRSAPFGLLAPRFNDDQIYEFAASSAGYTHGHPTGQVASGALAVLVASIMRGLPLDEALAQTRRLVADVDPNGETLAALDHAVRLAASNPCQPSSVEELGGGWVAEEALAIAVYCALSWSRPEHVLDALALAVTHSGDSDSTGAICGNILGALHGQSALPPHLVFEVEGRGTILELADDLVLELTAGDKLHGDHGPYTRWTDRYPGW